MNYDGYRELGITISATMIKDYFKCLKKIKLNKFNKPGEKAACERAVNDYERFFKSERFALYCPVPGEKVIRTIKERIENEVNDK